MTPVKVKRIKEMAVAGCKDEEIAAELHYSVGHIRTVRQNVGYSKWRIIKARRLKNFNSGMKPNEMAELEGIDVKSVERWIRKMRKAGYINVTSQETRSNQAVH